MSFLSRAPTDCVQYFTGISGSVKSYNYAGAQLLAGQRYNNCIRTEKGYCAIQWKESSTTSPDPFGVGAAPTTAIGANGATPTACLTGYVNIPALSPDGIQKIPIPPGSAQAYQSQVCGVNFGIEGMGTISSALVCKSIVYKNYNIYHTTHSLQHDHNHLCWESTQLLLVLTLLLLQQASIWIILRFI